jgi:pimeloyl-ACP methyl ester carboxylesterase/DNA-binding SARP family transcriptional activator
MVAIPPTAQNIEVAWEQPDIRRMLERFGSFCRYVHFDKRGTGASDRSGRIAEIDERVDDLRAVMDHAEIDHAHLFGVSEGGPMTLLFAATYPDRVDSVVLSGSGASLYPADLDDARRDELRAQQRRYASVWGTDQSPVAAGFAPSLVAADPHFAAWHRRYERLAASQDSLLDLLELTLHMDVREVLPDLDVPVLVVHRTDDPVVPVERGREVAAMVPGARLVELPGGDHFSYAGDVDTWMDEVERFVTGQVRSRRIADRTGHTVRVRTLGRFAVEVDGQEVPTSAWGSRRARQLCKRLVVARGWPVTRDELFDLLWPDEVDRQRLSARLSVQLSTVRRILGGGVIADREAVRLDLTEVDTDLEALHRATDDEEILAIGVGEFLPEDRYESWTDAPREEVRIRVVRAAQRLGQAALRADDRDRALALARRLIDIDPYGDAGHRLLVTTLRDAGDDAGSRRAHQAWVAAMAELGLPAPSWNDLWRD